LPDTLCRRWDAYCRGGGKQIYAILKALLTGFVPVLLVQLWQVRTHRLLECRERWLRAALPARCSF
jgi:hypothetical protein